MAEGNGADLGSVVSMLAEVLQGQERLRGDVGQIKGDVSQLKSDVSQLKSDVAVLKRDMAENKQDIVSLRQEVRLYHGAVTGHGIAISDMQVRVSRIETHLNLPPLETH